MQIQDKAFVEIDYRLTIDSGEEIDRSNDGQPLGFIVGANQILPALEQKLQGMGADQSAKLVIDAKDGYGQRDEELVKEIPRTNFPDDMKIEVGMMFQGRTPQGPATLKVIEVSDDAVKGDFNHPLAGQRLTFDVKVVSVREATPTELATAASCDTQGCGSGGCSSCG